MFDLISEHSGRVAQQTYQMEGQERDEASDGDFGGLGIEVIADMMAMNEFQGESREQG